MQVQTAMVVTPGEGSSSVGLHLVLCGQQAAEAAAPGVGSSEVALHRAVAGGETGERAEHFESSGKPKFGVEQRRQWEQLERFHRLWQAAQGHA